MTERIPTPLAAKRLVYKGEELRRKRQGTWDATTMVSVTSPEGAALRASQLASPEKVADAQPIAIEPRKNETLPNFKAACKFTTEKPRGNDEDDAGLVEIPAGDHSPPHEPTSLPTPLTTTVENRTAKAGLLPAKAVMSEAEGPKTETTPLALIAELRRRPIVQPEWLSLQETAIYCGYSEQQFSDFVKRGIAPKSVLFSRNARRLKRSDVDAWCAAGGPSAYSSKGEPGAVRR